MQPRARGRSRSDAALMLRRDSTQADFSTYDTRKNKISRQAFRIRKVVVSQRCMLYIYMHSSLCLVLFCNNGFIYMYYTSVQKLTPRLKKMAAKNRKSIPVHSNILCVLMNGALHISPPPAGDPAHSRLHSDYAMIKYPRSRLSIPHEKLFMVDRDNLVSSTHTHTLPCIVTQYTSYYTLMLCVLCVMQQVLWRRNTSSTFKQKSSR